MFVLEKKGWLFCFFFNLVLSWTMGIKGTIYLARYIIILSIVFIYFYFGCHLNKVCMWLRNAVACLLWSVQSVRSQEKMYTKGNFCYSWFFFSKGRSSRFTIWKIIWMAHEKVRGELFSHLLFSASMGIMRKYVLRKT